MTEMQCTVSCQSFLLFPLHHPRQSLHVYILIAIFKDTNGGERKGHEAGWRDETAQPAIPIPSPLNYYFDISLQCNGILCSSSWDLWCYFSQNCFLTATKRTRYGTQKKNMKMKISRESQTYRKDNRLSQHLLRIL